MMLGDYTGESDYDQLDSDSDPCISSSDEKDSKSIGGSPEHEAPASTICLPPKKLLCKFTGSLLRKKEARITLTPIFARRSSRFKPQRKLAL
eukprot:CAMPEP_0184482412 /NCGR_PEP_ID=MMETSP0113_2-20130426/3968_1 /TAXON_ID=91329 /ORGANISM="Norrisiella sphaerica, Strain BC52" /LENGTH=91 /DNA_ID=CAMNT_0026862119 /DNA_START=387 /DNA_END=662 /DNA_ORIENTATION=+